MITWQSNYNVCGLHDVPYCAICDQLTDFPVCVISVIYLRDHTIFEVSLLKARTYPKIICFDYTKKLRGVLIWDRWQMLATQIEKHSFLYYFSNAKTNKVIRRVHWLEILQGHPAIIPEGFILVAPSSAKKTVAPEEHEISIILAQTWCQFDVITGRIKSRHIDNSYRYIHICFSMMSSAPCDVAR